MRGVAVSIIVVFLLAAALLTLARRPNCQGDTVPSLISVFVWTCSTRGPDR